MKIKIIFCLSISFLLLFCLGCNKSESTLKPAYTTEEIKDIENEFIGGNPFGDDLLIADFSKNNYTFHEIKMFLDNNNLNIDKDGEDRLIIYPSLDVGGNYSIVIKYIVPGYYYSINEEDSYMAAFGIMNSIDSKTGDNQLIIQSFFKSKTYDNSLYGVYYGIEDTYKSIEVCLDYNKNLYHFELTDYNNPDNIKQEDGFLVLKEILRSIEF